MGFAFNEATLNAGFRDGDIPISADGITINDLDADAMLRLMEAKQVEALRDGETVTIHLPEDFDKIIFDKSENFIIRYPFVVEQIINGTPAQAAGLQTGDSLVGINGQKDMVTHEIMEGLLAGKEKELTLNLFRAGQELAIAITPNEFGKIGVGVRLPSQIYETVKHHYNFFTAFPAGVRIGIQQMKDYLGQFKYIFTKEGAQSLGGFGTIGNLFPDQWNWPAFWGMTAFLSVILGIMNLLPIPALDGGHVMFLLYEVVSGRKPNEKFMEYAQIAGMFLLFGLLIYANGMDIIRAFFQ